MNWTTDLKFIAAVLGGVVLALLLGSATTWRARLFTVGAGLFAAVLGTEPLIAWAGISFAGDGWPYLLAGALALSGDRLARRALQLIDTARIPWTGSSK